MIFLMVFYILLTLTEINSNTVTSPQIRILDVATKTSESRLIPHRVDYRNAFQPYFQHQNRFEPTAGPLKSYVIYDEHPVKIFKEWKANPSEDYSTSTPQNYLELRRQQNVEFPPNYYFQNERQILPPSTPTLAYRSVYSNIIKVFDNSLGDFDQNRFHSERYIKPFEGGVWKSQNPIVQDPIYPQYVSRRPLQHNLKVPENFPKVFSPNEKFHFPLFDDAVRPPLKFFYPQEGFYDTYTINYNKETARNPEEVEVLPEMAHKQKNPKKTFLCSFIRVNQRQFPERGGPCARNDEELPLISPEYPDYSGLPNYKIPVEHRRQHFQMKIIKRSEPNQSNERRQKRNAGIGYGYGAWGSPFSYENGYDGYFSSNYPTNGGYHNNYNYNSGYSTNRNRNQGHRSRYYSGSRYDDYDEDYQNNDDSNSRGLTGYLTNGGRRYKNRKNNNDDEDEDDDNENNSNNHEDDSDEEMERMNSNRRDTNDRRNNDDSRDRRRNNNSNNNNNNNNNNSNNNDDDDYRDNRRNNNRNNNSKRYNNNNNNNGNNNRRYNNDRYNDYSSNRNRYNNNGYNSNNGYGSSYGSYGSNYGGGYGNGGYGSSYGSNGGYGYGGYGNGFGSF